MTSQERMRLAVALAHPVAGASVVVRCVDGQQIVAGSHPAADLSVCELRRVVLASRRPDQPDWTRIVDDVTVSGSLGDLGAGIHRRRTREGVEQRWFAALLDPDTVLAVLRGLDTSGAPAVEGRVVADTDLDTAAVCISTADRDASGHLDAIALAAATDCLIAELHPLGVA